MGLHWELVTPCPDVPGCDCPAPATAPTYLGQVQYTDCGLSSSSVSSPTTCTQATCTAQVILDGEGNKIWKIIASECPGFADCMCPQAGGEPAEEFPLGYLNIMECYAL